MDVRSAITSDMIKSWTFSKLQFPFGSDNYNCINGKGHSLSPLNDDPPRALQSSSFLKRKTGFILRTFYFTSYIKYSKQ